MTAQAAPAASSSFYTAMRVLPKDRREAMFSLYGFCRAVDDIADERGSSSSAQRLAELERWRADIAELFVRRGPLHLAGLEKAVRRYGLRRQEFDAIIDGMEMDAAGDIRAPDWATLDLYCDRVASAVGRASVRIFGLDPKPGEALAHHLGRALQLTNILRDIDEDAAIGRLYLPREALADAGIATSDPQAAISHPAIDKACAPIVARARDHFVQADAIMTAAPRRAVRAPRIMGEAYKLYLRGMEARGFRAPRARVRLSRPRLLWIILRYAVI